MLLKGREIVLGVSGGIAVYKSVELLRLLCRDGAAVTVVMTANAQKFVAPLTFQTLSGRRVITDMFSPLAEVEIEHTSLADQGEVLVIAPATANIIGKCAHGIADDFLSTFYLVFHKHVIMAPAMNPNMFSNQAVQDNIRILKNRGVHFVDPECGEMACGAMGQGRLALPEVIFQSVLQKLQRANDFEGKTLIVTAGPTREPIDAVRFISNHSSGKMGYAIAKRARERGAKVILISGPVNIQPPAGIDFIPVETALEMREALRLHYEKADIIIKAAAVADFRPRNFSDQKIKKKEASLILELERNPDILAELGAKKGNKILVGFAAETQNLLDYALEKLREKNLDMIVANDVSRKDIGFGSDYNAGKFIFRNGQVEEFQRMTKEDLAETLLSRVLQL
ncbi:MAG: bifunctional phosphopantothenoylcysteine decarboxylase/phosphopantothenate--cysteine ligase CoaBC [Candidatus Tectomicrobia bacterium]|uniref:Coenzyme A biosynthesis bifunctional protein CoaBC n=1 Tax=Tectimicrobiota bacterium TaxID=2528274 RepID=A0A933GJ84_UNCTE|nr:bifunctional phosphopantothenoylcysteine decarboxylase/phosphopantothenate--cysteine ligase CoaBC [Candidatus Tectomicrobia bacterium]